MSPSANFRTGEKHRSSADYSADSKKQKTDDKELSSTRYVGFYSTFDVNAFIFCYKEAQKLIRFFVDENRLGERW